VTEQREIGIPLDAMNTLAELFFINLFALGAGILAFVIARFLAEFGSKSR